MPQKKKIQKKTKEVVGNRKRFDEVLLQMLKGVSVNVGKKK